MSLVFADQAFTHDPDRTPCKATSKTRLFATPPFNEDAALSLVAEKGMTKMAYREAIKGLGGTRDGREAQGKRRSRKAVWLNAGKASATN